MKWVIYLLTRDDDQRYVGMSRKFALHQRMWLHKTKSKQFVGRTFTITILEEGDHETIAGREAYWIEKLDTHRNGLNRTADGKGYRDSVTKFTTLGLRHSEQTKQLISEKGRGRVPWNLGARYSTPVLQGNPGGRRKAVLTEADVASIRQAYSTVPLVASRQSDGRNGPNPSGDFCKEMAALYGVSHQAIRAIVRHRTWKDVQG